MMNPTEKIEIAKRLRLSSEMEMSRDDVEKLLKDELAKPEDEIDVELVQLILEVLEDAPAAEQQQESWQQIDKRLAPKRRWLPVVNVMAKVAAVVALLLTLTFATYGTARAFNWEFLLRLMQPFAETFMLYSGDKPTTTTILEPAEVYRDALSDITQTDFITLSDCPDNIAGYPAKPLWMPEQFEYVQGNMYSDKHMTSITHVFLSTDGICIVDVVMFQEDNKTNAYGFEQIPDNSYSKYIEGYQVTFYLNTDDATLTASWLDENTHFCVAGAVTEEDLIRIITSMMN